MLKFNIYLEMCICSEVTTKKEETKQNAEWLPFLPPFQFGIVFAFSSFALLSLI